MPYRIFHLRVMAATLLLWGYSGVGSNSLPGASSALAQNAFAPSNLQQLGTCLTQATTCVSVQQAGSQPFLIIGPDGNISLGGGGFPITNVGPDGSMSGLIPAFPTSPSMPIVGPEGLVSEPLPVTANTVNPEIVVPAGPLSAPANALGGAGNAGSAGVPINTVGPETILGGPMPIAVTASNAAGEVPIMTAGPTIPLFEAATAIRAAANLDSQNYALNPTAYSSENDETSEESSLDDLAFRDETAEKIQTLVQPQIQQATTNYHIQVAVVPDTQRVRLTQPGQILGFEVVPPVSEEGYLVAVTPQMLPSLLVSQPDEIPVDEFNANTDIALDLSADNDTYAVLGEARALQFVGNIHRYRAEYAAAIDHYQQAFDRYQAIDNTFDSAIILNSLGAVHQEKGNYPQALDFYRQSQQFYQEIQDPLGEARSLNNIASVIQDQGDYSDALMLYEQAKERFSGTDQPKSTAAVLGNIGLIYSELGDYDSALTAYDQSLTLLEQIANQSGVNAVSADLGAILINIGLAHHKLEGFTSALDYYQQALAIATATENRLGEANLLNNIGFLYKDMDKPTLALQSLEKALKIHQQIGNRFGEAATLDSLGSLYREQQDYPQALDVYNQSLALYQKTQNLTEEAITLSNIGKTLDLQQRPDLAIVFFKQAVNQHELIRQKNITLSDQLQKSYVGTVEEIYRQLADLLLSQGRLLEAQQVLELLKLEELRGFTQNTRATWTGKELIKTDVEQAVVNSHGSLLAFAEALYECEKDFCSELEDLYQQREELERQYDQQVAALEDSLRQARTSDPLFYDPDSLADRAAEIVEAQPGTLLLYPLVLEDKLWLLWTTAGGVAGSIEVPVDQQTLGEAVLQFRYLLNTPYDYASHSELKKTSKQLYDWLIRPIAQELQANDIQSLIFAQDRVTRYIPMAALHDGDNYLIENYTISSILSAELTDTDDRLPDVSDTAMLGLGLSESVSGFNPLPNVPVELDVIVRSADSDPQGIYPGQVHLNRSFDRNALWQNVAGHNILHIATHAEFVPGKPEESYLMLGTGEKLSIADVEANGRRLRDVHLVVLSACETALGGPTDEGIEIAGISSYFLEANRAKAVMASLWQVNDNSTSVFMEAFYQSLASDMTKAEALQQAQVDMLNGDSNGIDRGFAHPYYWAPFILIGNGL